MNDALADLSGRDLAARIRSGDLSCTQVMECYLGRIASRNPRLNAIVSFIGDDAAMALAHDADARRAAGETMGPLFGLPMAPKELVDVKGLPTTNGSELFRDNIAANDALLTRRLRDAGALIIGKTNSPEFGFGSHTFNPIYGVTRNPHDLDRSAGGSSGGAAAALAGGLLPMADGSDMGGSLRNPASFCGVVGFRPSVGRVPASRGDFGWLARIATEGPMGRSVDDVALLLSVLAGPVPADPLALPEDPQLASGTVVPFDGKARIAWSVDCEEWSVEPEVAGVCEGSLGTFRSLGCTVETAHPDVHGAMDIFQRQRATAVWSLAKVLDARFEDWRGRIKETAAWNFDKGLALSAEEVLSGERERAALYRRFAAFFEDYDFLVLPTVQVRPFPVETEYPTEINGQTLETYLDWMASCCVISLTGLPAISVPCGRTADGLPVGLQIVGPPQADTAVLSIAQAFEAAIQFDPATPALD